MTIAESLTLAGIVLALATAMVSWLHANRADRRSAEAIELARHAEERADRLERISLESRDVQWVPREMVGRAGVSFQNTGSDRAHHVHLIVEPVHDNDWSRREQEHGTIAASGRVGMDLTALLRETAAKYEADPNLIVRARITWRSGEGVPQHAEFPQLHVSAPFQ